MNTEFTISNPEAYRVEGLEQIETPRLLVFEKPLLANRERLRRMCDAFASLRLMVKTFKSSAVLNYYVDAGLHAIKASGVAEARCMAANTAVADILISFPCFGPSIDGFLRLRQDFPGKRFSLIVSTVLAAQELSGKADTKVPVYLDVDPGMRRTGVAFGAPLREFARQVAALPRLDIVGLHVYDGHIHHSNAQAVTDYSTALMRTIDANRRDLASTCQIREVVTSSSLSAESNLEAHRRGGYAWLHTVSPGTSVLWDSNYNDLMPGRYDYAAAVATRVIDVIPNGGRHILTTDCGVKFGAAPDCGPVHVLAFPGYRFSSGYERHGSFAWLGMDRKTGAPLTQDMRAALGQPVLVIPQHICPTVNQYSFAYLVRDGKIQGKLPIDARDG